MLQTGLCETTRMDVENGVHEAVSRLDKGFLQIVSNTAALGMNMHGRPKPLTTQRPHTAGLGHSPHKDSQLGDAAEMLGDLVGGQVDQHISDSVETVHGWLLPFILHNQKAHYFREHFQMAALWGNCFDH